MNSLQNPPELKIPFSVSPREIIPFFTPDTRIGGLDTLFGGAFLLSMVLMILMFFQDKTGNLGFLVILWLTLSIFIFPEPWWARYTPQLWILPFIGILSSYYGKGLLISCLRNISMAVLFLNMFFVMVIYTGAETWGSIYLHRQLTILSKMSQDKPLPVAFQLHYPNRIRLREAGVKYFEISQPDCEHPIFFDRVGRQSSETATLACADIEEYKKLEGELLPGLEKLRSRLILRCSRVGQRRTAALGSRDEKLI